MTPRVSIILATHNRRDVVLNTLRRLDACGLDADEREVIVVDNASTDGTAEAAADMPGVRVLAQRGNLGSCAKSFGVCQARAEQILFLDDDSYPRPGCLPRMLRAFERLPRLGAAAFTVHLPDGSQECSALPHVFVGCGVGFRTAALRTVGGLDLSFFMQAEEYDVSFRLLGGGWQVETFADLQVEHLKTPQARRSERTTFYDIRNNLQVANRYLPDEAARTYAADWTLRYQWLAEQAGHGAAFRRGLRAGRWRVLVDGLRRPRPALNAEAFEAAFSWRRVQREMGRLVSLGVRRIVLADWGKNAYAFVRAAARAGLTVTALADDRFASPRREYRGVPMLHTAAALRIRHDAVVVANTSYVHAEKRAATLRDVTTTPVHCWFRAPILLADPDSMSSARAAALTAA
jgi:GT2 family glycosyltransferase